MTYSWDEEIRHDPNYATARQEAAEIDRRQFEDWTPDEPLKHRLQVPPLSEHAREIMADNAHYARECREGARLVLGWCLDRLRLQVGLVRVVGRHEAPVPDDPARVLPMSTDEDGQGWCVLVRDVEGWER